LSSESAGNKEQEEPQNARGRLKKRKEATQVSSCLFWRLQTAEKALRDFLIAFLDPPPPVAAGRSKTKTPTQKIGP
jgi:hypothetical protein